MAETLKEHHSSGAPALVLFHAYTKTMTFSRAATVLCGFLELPVLAVVYAGPATVTEYVTPAPLLELTSVSVKGMYPAPHIHEHLVTANCVHLHAQHEQPGAHCEQWHGHHKAH